MNIILNSYPQSDHLHPMNNRTRAQERWEIMSIILNSHSQSDHLQAMNDRTWAQER